MAEKEERIRVLVAKNPCKECPVKKCTRKCMFGILFEKAPGITRAEAIERMAKALFRVDNVLALDIGFEQLTKQKQLTYKVFAEATLNALLSEGEKIK